MTSAPAVLRNFEWLNAAYLASRTQVTAVILCSAAINALYLAPSLFMMQVYDRVLTSGNFFTLLALSVVLVLALLTLATLDAMRSRILAHIGRRLDRQFGYQILNRAMNNRSLSVGNPIREFDRLRAEATGATATALLDAPWALLFVGACFLVHPMIGLTALVSAIALIGLSIVADRTLSDPTSRQSAELARTYARQDADASLGDIARALGMTDHLIARQQGARSDVLQAQGHSARIATLFTAATRTFRMFSQSASLIVAAVLAINQEVSVGAIIAVSILTARALAPIEQIVGLWRNFGQLRHAFTVVSDVLKPSAARSYLPLPAARGAVALEGVAYAVPGRIAPIISRLTLSIEPGETVAVLGPSGAGKSTLLRLIAGAIEPSRGTIRLDASSYNDWDPVTRGKHIGFLAQDVGLFAGSIAQNIARFLAADGQSMDDATGNKVVAAAQAANAHELIAMLPGSYGTEIHARSAALSAGQAQRVGLARCLFDDPVVLVLDEPNAHLDTDGEKALVAALQKAKSRGTTIVFSTHRSNLIDLADKIALLRSGRLVLFGPRKEVLAKLSGATGERRQVADLGAD